MKDKKIVGIVWLDERNALPADLFSFFSSYDVHVRIILPDEKRKIDLLVIPDTGTFNTTIAAFLPKYKVPPAFPPSSQYQEAFRIYHLDYWWSKILSTNIIGIGTGALLCHAHMGRKIIYEDGQLIPDGEDYRQDKDGVFRYDIDNGPFLGLSHFDPTRKFVVDKVNRFLNPGEDLHAVPVTV